MSKELNEIIRDHAMLVSVHIKHWPASVKDNAAARAAAEDSGAEGSGAYKAHKNLMFKNDARLKAVQKAGYELRALHNETTMSWDSGKSPFRMMPTTQFEQYTRRIAKAKSNYDAKLKEFIDNYLVDAAAARRALNIEGDPDAHRLYPTEEQLVHKFGVELAFEPIPEGRQFRNIPESAVGALAQAHEKRVTDRYEAAFELACDEVLESLAHLRSLVQAPCVDDKAQRWKDSSVTNIVTQSKMLKHFDLKGNTEHADWCQEVNSYFSSYDKKSLTALRQPQNEELRTELADDIANMEIKLENIREGNTE